MGKYTDVHVYGTVLKVDQGIGEDINTQHYLIGIGLARSEIMSITCTCTLTK